MPTPCRYSVIIPAHNAEASITGAVRSVLDQGFEGVEVIVIDDASADATAARVRELDDARVRLISFPTNRGVSAARNAGVEAARGEIVAFLDADDAHYPGFLARTWAALDAGDEVDAVVVGRTVRTDAPGTAHPRYASAAPRTRGVVSGAEALAAVLTDHLTPFPWDKAVRRTLLGTHPFPEGIARFEDLVTMALVLSRARRVRVLPAPLIEYRVSGGSLTWGRVPERSERDAALGFLTESLGEVRVGALARQVATLECLMTVLIAQAAVLHGDEARFAAARRDLSLRLLVSALRANPTIGGAGIVARFLPALFRTLIQRRTRATYGASIEHS